MKKTIFCCDRCGVVIQDIVYTLTVYGDAVPDAKNVRGEDLLKMQANNERQNAALAEGTDRHLCRKCKDEITDGLFVL